MFSGAAVLCTGRAIRSSNSREHACCIYIVSSHVSALVWAWSEERGMLRLSEAGGSHDQTSRQKNKTIQHPAWISGGRRCLHKIWLKRFANVPKKCKQMALIWIWLLPTPITTFPVSPESPAAEFLKFIWFPLNVLPQQRLIKYDPWRLERIWAGLLFFKENQA